MPSVTVGSVTYEFSETYVITTIGGIQIPEQGYWFLQPAFIRSLQLNGVIGTDFTLGHIKQWILSHWNSLRASQYSSFLFESIQAMFSGATSSHTQREAQELIGYHSRHMSDETTVQCVNSWSGSAQRAFLLISGEGDEQTPETVTFYGLGNVSRTWSWMHREPRATNNHWETLMNYSFTPPDLPFLTCPNEKTEMYFGMELELSTRLSVKELQAINTSVEPQREYWFYFKQDSSITGNYDSRVELVTVPMSVRRLRQEWKIFMKKIKDLVEARGESISDYFDTSTDLNNGIHIHVSKNAFIQSHARDNRHKFRFIAAFNQWESSMQDWLQKISKRPISLKDSEYCHVHPGLDGYTLARRLRNGPIRHDRHSACHESSQTVEVRIFQGIVDLDHILSCIELTDAMFEYTQMAPHSAFGAAFPQYFSDYVFQQPGRKRAKEVLAQCV